jgi:RNA polymerase sigma factor (sigma-70 family)
MNTTLDDFDAIAKQYRDLVRMKVRQFARINPLHVRRLGSADLFQTALIALWKATKTYNGRIPFHAYAAVLIQRELFRCIRFRHYLQKEKLIDEYPEFTTIRYYDVSRVVETNDLLDHVLKVAKRILTKRQYRCLNYRYFDKPNKLTSFAEIARRLKCKTRAAMSLCNEALFKLKVAFDVPTKRKTTYVTLEKKQPRSSET